MYAAYLYQPPEYRTYESEYLKSIKSSFLVTDDFKIHYTHAGEGEPLILIHGGGGWLYSYRHNILTLSQRFSVYALDMPGAGYTVPLGKKTPKYDFEMMSQVLLEFMNKLGIEKASLVGNSWGESWAIYFTHKYPERVNKLILIRSVGFDVPDVLIWELLKYPIVGELISKFATRNTVKREYKRVFFNKELVTEEMVREIYIPLSFRHNRKAQYLLKRNLNLKLTEQAMPKINKPTLIIWGAQDEYLSVKLAYRFKESIPNSKLIILENCGHVPQEEYPDKFNQLIIDFLMDN